MLFLPTPLLAKKRQMFVWDFCSCWLMGGLLREMFFSQVGEQEKVGAELQINKDNFEFENHLIELRG